MYTICVFCGSSLGNKEAYRQNAQILGKLLVKNNCRLVYGGGKVGLMGQIADQVLEAGGEAIGVIPHFLAKEEIAHPALSELRRVDSMHERKRQMAELADAFLTLPGGIGTFEEFFEILTWRQLALHHKPVALLNTSGYYDALLRFLDQAVSEGFFRKETRDLILSDDSPERLLEKVIASIRPDGEVDTAKT